MPVPWILHCFPAIQRRRHRTGPGNHRYGRQHDDPGLAPPLVLRLSLAGRTIAYTGDTAWTGAITAAAADVDLLIAEAYYRDKNIPYHLRLADLDTRRDQITARRVILTHMSTDVLASTHDGAFVRG